MDTFLSGFSQLGILFHQLGVVFEYAWFIILPPALFFIFKIMWMDHVNTKYVMTIKYVMLEIIPPKDIEKSPQLMELVFTGIAGTDKGLNVIEREIQGMVAPTFSFEMANNGDGRVHFYIRTPVRFRNLIEAHLYAQYPDLEIVETDDYVNKIPQHIPNEEWNLFGFDFGLLKSGKLDAYPIKTYHYFKEDVTGKMMDPLAGLIETMGKLGPGQNIWLQYIISAERATWFNSGKALIDEIVKGAKPKEPGVIESLAMGIFGFIGTIFRGILGISAPEAPAKKEAKLDPIEFRLTSTQKKVLEALENNVSKPPFKVKMRLIYVGKRSVFDKSFVSSFVGGLKQFNDAHLNSLVPTDAAKTEAFYLFQNFRLLYQQKRLYRRYRERSRDPYSSLFTLTASELATLFHIPDASVNTPALSRVSAKRGGAPSNLPIK